MKTKLEPDYNQEQAKRAERAGAVTSADDLPQPGDDVDGSRMSELPYRAQDFPNSRIDLGKVHPDSYPVRESEYRQPGPVADLPERVSQAEIVQANRDLWYNCGPSDNEADAPILNGTKVTENLVFHPEREARQR